MYKNDNSVKIIVALFFSVFFLVLSVGEAKTAEPVGVTAAESGGQYVNLNNYLIVYTKENYQGTAYRLPYETTNTHIWNFYNEKMQNIGDLSRQRWSRSDMIHLNIKSIKLHSFVHVKLFEGENYRGYCVKITKDLPNLRGLMLPKIQSLSVGRTCSDKWSRRRYNIFIYNKLARKIRYRLKVNGKWQSAYTVIKRKTTVRPSVDSNQAVQVEVQFLDLTWKRLSTKTLKWNFNNYINVYKEGRNLKCVLKH